MKDSILNNHIRIEHCLDNKNKAQLNKYYNIVESRKIEELKSPKIINEHTKIVNSLLLLKDGRVASCTHDNTIRIYDPSNDYNCIQVIKRHNNRINSICQLDDGTIVSGSLDKSIMIGDYTINNAHKYYIYKVITLPNNRIASCSWDQTIKIWKSDPPYSDTPIRVLTDSIVISILYIKERDIILSADFFSMLRLWNMTTYQCETVIKGVYCYSTNSLYQIDKDRVIVGGNKSLYIVNVNIDKCVVEKTIKDASIGKIFCFLKLRDDQTILCGSDYGTFCFYDINKEQYKMTKNNHYDGINELLLIDDNTFLSCSEDKTITLWKY